MANQYLVTGGAGFIGSHLVDHLMAAGEQVVVIDNFNDFYDPQIKRENCKQHESNANYKLYEGNLCDYDFVAKIFAENQITHIIHLAAMAGVRPSIKNPVLYDRNNNGSTMNLLDLAVETKVTKFVFASSSSVYGSRSNVPFVESEDITKPISPYAATKVAGEAICHTMSHLYNLPVVCLRFFTVYGPRQRPDLAIHKFTKLIDEGQEIPVYGDGSAKRDFTYIEDIIDGVVKAIDYDFSKSDLPNFDIFNLGESQTTDVNTLIKMIESSLGKQANINYMDPQPGDVPITYADVTKAKSKLGYNPQTQIDSGIDKFVQWYLNYKKITA